MIYVYLTIFAFFTSMHLVASYKNNKPLRDFSKGYILLSLLGFYCESVDVVYWPIVVAILASWLGDLLLIPKGVKWFTAGGILFMISHAFFCVSYTKDFYFDNIPIWFIILLGALFVAAVTFIFTKLRVHLPKALFIPMFFYLLINGTMNCFAWYRLIGNFCPATIITAIGAILFFASDTALFFVRFNKQSRMKSHFFVMLTYSIGEFLIILGLVLI